MDKLRIIVIYVKTIYKLGKDVHMYMYIYTYTYINTGKCPCQASCKLGSCKLRSCEINLTQT